MERERREELGRYKWDLEEVKVAFEDCECIEDYNATVDDYDDIYSPYNHYDIDKIKEDEEIDEDGFQETKEEAIRTIDSIILELEDLLD